MTRSQGQVRIYTIGHSNHSMQRFLALLIEYDLVQIVDVRSQPYSRWVPHFNRERLSKELAANGIAYVHLPELGGRPLDPAVIGADGKPDYARVRAGHSFIEALESLLALAEHGPTAIMCAEGDHRRCHRHWLIEPALLQRNVGVLHIRFDGSAQQAAEEWRQASLL
jgi:uncharacterized protein (DUF488 family)